jgi:hypothetical protein
MVFQFWKFLSRREKQAAFSDLEALDRKPLCRHTAPLYVVLAAHNSAIRWTQEVTTALMPSLVSYIFGT